ncbi:MAG: cation-translocating P-type ATPase [Candidatus Galacturonibacter soehngenii]|nr:cation-translocating P-type ATPase [Candidatus Galacturonibacter soehngenii]
MKHIEALLEWGGIKRDIICLVLSAFALLLSIFDLIIMPFDMAWFAILLCGVPIILEAVIGLVTEFDIKADVLVSIALVAAVIIGEHFAAGEIAFIMQLGALLEEVTVAKARAGIERLVNLTPQTARKLFEEGEKIIPADQVMIGDLIRVLPGETIPVDGIILEGHTSANQAVMTGESLPVDKSVEDEVFSGTVNQFGSFDMKATKVGNDSSIQRMIRLVQSADASKAKIVGIADKWATWIVIIALSFAALTWFFSGEIIRAVTILVVFCPCALVLATPTAIMAAIGNATKHGFLVREGDALERLASVSKITFDKTGTLTYGKPKVIAVSSVKEDITKEELYEYAVCVEARSEHPLGKAIVESYENEKAKEQKEVKGFKMLPGRGVTGIVGDTIVLAGNKQLLLEYSIAISDRVLKEVDQYLEKGCTIIYLSLNHELAGYLVLSDTIRDEAIKMVDEIKSSGMVPVLLTGDHERSASHIATLLGIKDIHSNCLPEDKLNYIETYQKEGKKVCMIGDGINDAPALKMAYIGIAMGGIGSDIAVEAADIALVNDDLKELPHLILLSKKMMLKIKYNLAFSMILNFVAIILAVSGILNPVMGALVHNAGSIFVIINSSLLLKWRKSK